ncbi:hypothetical protein K443DRAFT_365682 [Laccaria amethystina LaAM-08-1]|uniref:Uncharacterized protein n=1 Tax=Laccaria amethystina LaAM-08-1 TaxID=1095629 RepID=A0A0C9WRT3_9AGAR|nr:hypothetical protein K443DRAFT_365682 [Laccaria amethystina LaAM-08-1]
MYLNIQRGIALTSPRFTMWPQYIVTAFEKISPEADEYVFYGPWNSVLNHCFLINEGYVICPHLPIAQVHAGTRDTVDFVVTLSAMKNEATIFFVEVKAPKYLGNTYARAAANEQMRLRFYQSVRSSPSKMHGISAFGTDVCFYELEKENPIISLPPPAAEYSRVIVVDVAPENWWNLNVLDQEGYDKFTEVVEEAKVSS